MKKELNQAEVIKQFRVVHGRKYSYDEAVISHMRTKIEIRCQKHGLFLQSPHEHLRGRRCPHCMLGAGARMKKAAAGATFVTKARMIHGNKYDYSAALYNGRKVKVKIKCPKHGFFLQTPNNHLAGFGCADCGDERKVLARKMQPEEFYARCKKRHHNRYSYSQKTYNGPDSIIVALCPKHGSFKAKGRNHLWLGQGCPKCAGKRRGLTKRVKWPEFHKLAQELHGDLYTYDKKSYKMLSSNMRINCKAHGWFAQKPQKHLAGQGCPKCARRDHKGFWRPEDLNPKMRNQPCILYYFRLSNLNEIFYKIGVTNNIARRVRTIELTTDYAVAVLYKSLSTRFESISQERALHKKFRAFRYIPKKHFAGHTECFAQDILGKDIVLQNQEIL